MPRPETPNGTKSTGAELRRLVDELVAMKMVKPDFWGVVALHIRDGRLQHVKLEETLKFAEEEEGKKE